MRFDVAYDVITDEVYLADSGKEMRILDISTMPVVAKKATSLEARVRRLLPCQMFFLDDEPTRKKE
jgi:hypothetical protein